MKKTITSEMIKFVNVRDLTKMYEKPSTSKFQHALDDGDADTIIFQPQKRMSLFTVLILTYLPSFCIILIQVKTQ